MVAPNYLKMNSSRGGLLLFLCQDNIKRSITTTQHYITRGSYKCISTQLLSHTVWCFKNVFSKFSSWTFKRTQYPHENAVQGGWEENSDHRTSLPKYSSWTFKCRDNFFEDFQVVTGQCLLKIISWKCE